MIDVKLEDGNIVSIGKMEEIGKHGTWAAHFSASDTVRISEYELNEISAVIRLSKQQGQ